jgi:hypothetical protein
VEDKVAVLIGLPALDEGEVSRERLLKEISLVVEGSDLTGLRVRDYCLTFVAVASRDLASLKEGSSTSWRIESGNTSTTSSELFGEVALRSEVELELTVEVLLLKDCVHSNVGSVYSAYLVVLE